MDNGNFMFNWPTSAEAKKDYFLTTEELSVLEYRIPPWHRFGMGRPTKYFDPKDLKRLAETKYGVEGLKAKVASREQKNRKRQLNEEKKVDQEKEYEAKKSKLIKENPNSLNQDVADLTGKGIFFLKSNNSWMLIWLFSHSYSIFTRKIQSLVISGPISLDSSPHFILNN